VNLLEQTRDAAAVVVAKWREFDCGDLPCLTIHGDVELAPSSISWRAGSVSSVDSQAGAIDEQMDGA